MNPLSPFLYYRRHKAWALPVPATVILTGGIALDVMLSRMHAVEIIGRRKIVYRLPQRSITTRS